jgi:hypothetical protein
LIKKKKESKTWFSVNCWSLKEKIIYTIRNRKSIRKTKRQINQLFKLAKLKEFQNGCTPLVMIALFGEKRRRQIMGIFAANDRS